MKRMLILQKKEKSSKRSLVDVNCDSDNPAGIFPPEVRKKFAQIVEVEKKEFKFFPKKCFSPKCSSRPVAF